MSDGVVKQKNIPLLMAFFRRTIYSDRYVFAQILSFCAQLYSILRIQMEIINYEAVNIT